MSLAMSLVNQVVLQCSLVGAVFIMPASKIVRAQR